MRCYKMVVVSTPLGKRLICSYYIWVFFMPIL
nr:MAG TPA: hypothetical protein [Caudoviricetes sp.]